MKHYADGWVQLSHSYPTIDVFWLDGFPVAEPDKQYSHGYGPEKRHSPIYDYSNGGIGTVQWLNVTRNTAAVLKADGGWKTGGNFHLWVSTGARTLPYELPLPYPVTITPGDSSGWQDLKREAIALAEEVLGLRMLDD